MMEEFRKAYDLLVEVAPVTNEMTHGSFLSFYCMLLEEWCKSNQLKIENVLDKIVDTVREVNEEEGRY